jgi:hypothetical protein
MPGIDTIESLLQALEGTEARMLRSIPPWLQALFRWEHKALRVNGRTIASPL